MAIDTTRNEGIFFHIDLITLHSFGNVMTGLFLAELISLHNHFQEEQGKKWTGEFYRSQKQIEVILKFARKHHQNVSVKELVNAGFMTVSKKGTPARYFFRLNEEKIQKFLKDNKKYSADFLEKLKKMKSENQSTAKSENQSTIDDTQIFDDTQRKESSKEDSCSASNRTFSYGKSFRDENGKLKIVRRKNPVQPTSLSSQSNTLSKENKSNPVPKENINGAAPQNNPIPKIKKKSKVDPDLDNMSADGFKKDPPKPKYEYTIKDIQLFNFFVSIGFTKHQEGTKIYYRSMDYIHELLGKHKPPYSWCKSVHDSFKSTKPTVDEIEEVAKYYLANAKKVDKTIANFIYNPGFNGNSDYSPMCEWFGKMERDCTDNLTGDEALLSKWFKRENMEGSLNANNYKRIVIDVKKACEGYSLNRSMSHIHHGEIIEPFFDYVKEKLNSLSFRIEYINGEKFAKEFASAMLTRGVLGYN